MKEYSCGDVVPGCGAQFVAADETEMLALCTVHAQHAHGLAEAQMPDDLIARIRAVITTSPRPTPHHAHLPSDLAQPDE